MWSCNRRIFLSGALALGACGFEPVYGPGQSANALLGRIQLDAPQDTRAYAFNRRFEDRMGRSTGPYRLSVSITTTQQGLGSTSSGSTTRFRVLGTATYTLANAEGVAVTQGETSGFTGYSTTGSTVATLAGERDAVERLMTLLADQVIDELLLVAADLPT